MKNLKDYLVNVANVLSKCPCIFCNCSYDTFLCVNFLHGEHKDIMSNFCFFKI
jgi:hypothetical protein